MDLLTIFGLLLVTLIMLISFFIYELQKSERETKRYLESTIFLEGEQCWWLLEYRVSDSNFQNALQ